MAARRRFNGMPFTLSQRRKCSVSDEVAQLQYLAASRRAASFKALMIRHQRSRRSTTDTARPPVSPDSPPELPVAARASDELEMSGTNAFPR
jgi:hypothetical protein